ncbi:MAG: hypothetical protein A2085_09750 [Gemmatimonadetes bacterium GWC2_71_10]|nr:MAG: hypothetical protein A2085_09750 [Gemmatimonadetes bacterium GWC2_71_10]
MVPRFWICGPPIWRLASTSMGRCRRTARERMMAVNVASAPMTSTSPVMRMRRSGVRRDRSRKRVAWSVPKLSST